MAGIAPRAPQVGLLALALLVALAPVAAKVPADATFELDAVTYLYAAGVLGSGRTGMGDGGEGSTSLPYHACAFVMLHPGTPNGRVFVRGLYANATPVDLFVESFVLPDGKRGYTQDAVAEVDGHQALSDLALKGNGSLRVDSDRYLDPATDNDTMTGRVALLSAGVRDDLTGSRLPAAVPDLDRELHIELTSLPGQSPTQAQFTFASDPLLPPTEAFGAMHVFANSKFGGRAVLDIATQANAPDGMNELTFTLLSPSGKMVGMTTLAPALLAGDSATVEAPLDEFGAYLLLVDGKVALGGYSVQVTLEPPPDFRLHLWWENVTFGSQAYDDYVACAEAVGSPNEVVAVESINARPDPPQFNLKLVIVGIAAGAGVIVLAVKLVSDQVSLSAFRKSK